eukprot:scaffold1913_cov100-Cylindrotheca_fusiformis.AAC.2
METTPKGQDFGEQVHHRNGFYDQGHRNYYDMNPTRELLLDYFVSHVLAFIRFQSKFWKCLADDIRIKLDCD